MKKQKHVVDRNGKKCVRSIDLKNKLNINYLDLTNTAEKAGPYDWPVLYCDTDILPDYLALYDEVGSYHKTNNTGVCWFMYDNEFDGEHGLYNAIYYKNEKRLAQFKARFEGVKFFISPDISILGDVDEAENIYRMKKIREITIWLTLEIKAVVIPLITFPSIEKMPLYLMGLDRCKTIAFSTKGAMRDEFEQNVLREAISYVVDEFSELNSIVVYDVCGDERRTLELFRYAIERGIRVVIPDNTLKRRNMALRRRAA